MNAFQIKAIMAVLMLLDHLRYINGLVPADVAAVFTVLSRCVAPMFAYFAVEGGQTYPRYQEILPAPLCPGLALQ